MKHSYFEISLMYYDEGNVCFYLCDTANSTLSLLFKQCVKKKLLSVTRFYLVDQFIDTPNSTKARLRSGIYQIRTKLSQDSVQTKHVKCAHKYI